MIHQDWPIYTLGKRKNTTTFDGNQTTDSYMLLEGRCRVAERLVKLYTTFIGFAVLDKTTNIALALALSELISFLLLFNSLECRLPLPILIVPSHTIDRY